MTEEKLMRVLTTEPITQKELASLLNCSDSEIRSTIHDLRMEGVKVCSGYDGVWLWNGKDNSWELTKNHIRSRAMSMLTLLRAMELSYDGEQLEVNV